MAEDRKSSRTMFSFSMKTNGQAMADCQKYSFEDFVQSKVVFPWSNTLFKEKLISSRIIFQKCTLTKIQIYVVFLYFKSYNCYIHRRDLKMMSKEMIR